MQPKRRVGKWFCNENVDFTTRKKLLVYKFQTLCFIPRKEMIFYYFFYVFEAANSE